MPNPFDQFDATVQSNPFDQFDVDLASQIPGNMTPSVAAKLYLTNHPESYTDPSSYLDKGRGVIEAGISTVAGIPASIAELWGQSFFNTKPGEVSKEFYQPRTEEGKEYTEDVGSVVNHDILPLMGVHLPSKFSPSDASVNKIIDNAVKKEKAAPSVVDDVLKRQADIDAAKSPTGNPFDKFDWMNPPELTPADKQIAATHDEFIQNQLKNLDENINAKDAATEHQAGIDSNIANLHDQDILQKLQETDREQTIADRRNAAGVDEPNPEVYSPEASPENPADQSYIDPQAQVFKGDPSEPNAVYALDQQTKAMEQALLSGDLPKAGEPLKGLQDPTMYGGQRSNSPLGKGFKGQGGAIDPTLLTFGLNRVVNKVMGKLDMIPKDPDVPTSIKNSYGAKDSANWNLTASGASLENLRRGVPIIAAAQHLVQNAVKRANLAITKRVAPVETMLGRLSRKEFSEVSGVIKAEMLRGSKFDPEALAGMSVKQQQTYARYRAMAEDTYNTINAKRKEQGLPFITHHEAYAGAMWKGDYRRALYEVSEDAATGKRHVWSLAADTKRGLEKQTAALLEDHPELTFDPKKDAVIKHTSNAPDMQSAMTTMIDILGRDDPAVARMQKYVQDTMTKQAQTFLGQNKHFIDKSGVRGFVGDRPGYTGFSEGAAFMNQQMQLARNTYKWAEMQTAGSGIKDILTDPRLKEEQPNNLAFIREYYKHNTGLSTAKWVSALSDAVREGTGFNPKLLGKGADATRGWFVLQKLMTSAGYTLMTAYQSTFILAHLAHEFSTGTRGNILSAIPVGISMGAATMFKHYAEFASDYANVWKTAKDSGVSQDTMNFYGRAMKYAEDNGITTQSIYQHNPIENSFSPTHTVVDGLGRTISAPEGFSRSIAFMTAVEYLRTSGKFKNDIDLFQRAETLTNSAIADHRTGERPIIFAKGGGMGRLAGNLQTWPINFYNQLNYFRNEAWKGNIAPISAFLATQFALGGVMGIPYARDLDKLYFLIKDHMLSTSSWAKAQQNEFWSDPKMWMVNHLGDPEVWQQLQDKTGLNLSSVQKNVGEATVYGAASKVTGIGMTNRLAAPGGEEMLQNPAAPFMDIGKQALLAGKAVYDPEKGFFNRDNVAQSVMASAPPGLQGLAEYSQQLRGSTLDQRTVNGQQQNLAMMPGNIEKHQAVYARTPSDDNLRLMGLRSQPETMEREVGYRTNRATEVATQKAASIPDAFYAAVKTGNTKAAEEYFKDYTLLTGKEITNEQMEQQINQNYFTTLERATTGAKTVAAMQNIARARAIFNQVQENAHK